MRPRPVQMNHTADLTTSTCHWLDAAFRHLWEEAIQQQQQHTTENSLANNPEQQYIHICMHAVYIETCAIYYYSHSSWRLYASGIGSDVASSSRHIIIRDWCCYKWNYFACDPVFIIKWISYARQCVSASRCRSFPTAGEEEERKKRNSNESRGRRRRKKNKRWTEWEWENE